MTVNSESNVIVVTAPDDENDAEATPGVPGNTGLSLREAINYANSTSGWQSILVPSGYVISIADVLPLPTDASGVDIVGDGAVIDGSGNNDMCFPQLPSNTNVFGLEIHNCKAEPIRTEWGTTGSQLPRLYIHNNPGPVRMDGIGNTLVPYNTVVLGSAGGVLAVGTSNIMWSTFTDNSYRAVDLPSSSPGSPVLGNVFAGNETGVLISGDDNFIAHNLFHANSTVGFATGNGVTGTVLQNNIFMRHQAWGMWADDSELSARDHNDYSNNTSGWCDACRALGTGIQAVDPMLLGAAGGDFRLDPDSLLTDAGTNTGYDVNGTMAGIFNGAFPDMGAFESPQRVSGAKRAPDDVRPARGEGARRPP